MDSKLPIIHILNDLENVESSLNYLLTKNSPICIDTETDGLRRNRKVIGIGLSASDQESFYIPILVFKEQQLQSPWNEEAFKSLKSKLLWFFSFNLKLIGHNITFDVIALENLLGINIIDSVHCDTQALAHLVYNEEGPLGLKPLSTELFNIQASSSQDDVKESVKKNGGKVSKENFELYKADWELIGRYCALDCYYTYKLYNTLYPEIEKQNFTYIWENEIKPLSKVTYELNSQGFTVDVTYFQNLKTSIEIAIKSLEDQIFKEISPFIEGYVADKVLSETKFTARSQIGRQLITNGWAEKTEDNNLRIINAPKSLELAKSLYQQKKPLFNLDSNDDKAYILYDVLKLPCSKLTESGKKATDAKTLIDLCEQAKQHSNDEHSPVIDLLLQRSKERKILSTYVESILENNINGKIYASFRQTGTISGRYSSGEPINFQNLPRDDKRIKKGFIPQQNGMLIGADYESAEPKAFAHISGEERLKKIFKEDLDFYSTIAIDVENLKGVSANPKDKNYLKTIAPSARQIAKTYCLAIPYGAKGGRIAKLLKLEYQEAQELVDKYLNTYPKLKQWMKDSEDKTLKVGYITSIYGRKRRASTVHNLYKKYGITNFSKYSINQLVSKYGILEDPLKLYLECNNNLNNAKNFQIQSICASVINKAMIEFIEKRQQKCPNARIIMMIHDEIILSSPKEEALAAADLLKECMESNEFTKRLDVKMKADPIITEKNLSEAK